MIDHKRAPFGEFLTKNQILHPNLFPSQGLKPIHDREHVWNLIVDMTKYGFHVDAFTETEGGRWLPGAYLHALQSTDTIEDWVSGKKPVTLWSLTKIHSIRFADWLNHQMEWDNISGFRRGWSCFDQGQDDIKRFNHLNICRLNKPAKTMYDHVMEFDGDSLFVEYTIESHGNSGNGWDDPGEAPEICIWRVTVLEHGGIELDISNPRLQEFYERVEERVIEHVHETSYDSYEDDYL